MVLYSVSYSPGPLKFVRINSPLLHLGRDSINQKGARCSSVVRAFAHGAMGRRIDPSWGGHIELFLVPASAPRLVLHDWCNKGCGMCYPVLWDGACKRTLAANRKD